MTLQVQVVVGLLGLLVGLDFLQLLIAWLISFGTAGPVCIARKKTYWLNIQDQALKHMRLLPVDQMELVLLCVKI